MTTPSFDEVASSYRDVVQESINFIGVEHDYFVRRKVDVLLSLVGRHLGDPARQRVLDVGAGIGTTDTGLVPQVRDLVGCDPSLRSVKEAIGRNPGVSYTASNGTSLPHPDGVFDLAFTVNVLHHVEPPDREGFIAEMTRVVRSGGLVAVVEHNPLNPLTRRSVGNCAFDEGVELLGRRELRARLHSAGLQEVEHRYIVFSPFDVGWHHRVEDRLLGRLPLGAQHCLVARRP